MTVTTINKHFTDVPLIIDDERAGKRCAHRTHRPGRFRGSLRIGSPEDFGKIALGFTENCISLVDRTETALGSDQNCVPNVVGN